MYEGITFPTLPNRPFFYTNFVETVDGKIQVLQNTQKYWPIGSKLDHDTLIELRTYADALVHGKNTAYGHRTLDSLGREEFREQRKRLGKSEYLPYIVVSGHPDESLIPNLTATDQQKPMLITIEETNVFPTLEKIVDVERIGKNKVDIAGLSSLLASKGYKHVLVEGGAHLLGEFLKNKLIDEMFVTIAPKIFGNGKSLTLTMVEGFLLEPNEVPQLDILSVKQVENELYLRYKVKY